MQCSQKMDSYCTYYIVGAQEILIHPPTQPLTHPSPTDPFIHPVMHYPCSQSLLSTYSVLDPMSASGMEPKLPETQSAYRPAQTLCSGQMHRCHTLVSLPALLCPFPYPWYLQILQLLKIFNKSLSFRAAHSKSREVKYLGKDCTWLRALPDLEPRSSHGGKLVSATRVHAVG